MGISTAVPVMFRMSKQADGDDDADRIFSYSNIAPIVFRPECSMLAVNLRQMTSFSRSRTGLESIFSSIWS